MTLLPMLLLAALAGWLIYRDCSQLGEARRFVRVDYRSRGNRGRRAGSGRR